MNRHFEEKPWKVMRSRPHTPSAEPAMGRSRAEEPPADERVEWAVGPVSLELSSRVPCDDRDPSVDDEDEEGSDSGRGAGAKVGGSRKDIQHRGDKGTAAAQTQMPSTKPKARTLVASRRLIDGNDVASLRDQSHPPLLTLTGTVSLAATDPKSSSALHASISGEASVSAVLQDAAEPGPKRQLANSSREEAQKQYYEDLWKQVEERKQERERERRRKVTDEKKHNDTVQHSIWGMPGSGAPNHLGTARRTNSLRSAGILPQEQIRDTGFHRP